jgi:hypothetical protein
VDNWKKDLHSNVDKFDVWFFKEDIYNEIWCSWDC